VADRAIALVGAAHDLIAVVSVFPSQLLTDEMLRRPVESTQYAAYEYQACLKKAQMTPNMSRKGDCWDNAPMESFFSTLKRERVHRRRYWSRQEATEDLSNYLDRYNHVRRHSQLGGISPVRFEASRFHT